MNKDHRIWLAVPPEEKDDAIKAHPRLDNGQHAIVWDPEQRLWYAPPGVDLSKFERWLPQPQNLSMESDDPVTEFAQVLESAGFVLKESPVMDGATHRVATKADKNGVKSGVYKGFLDGRPAGWYRDYRSSEKEATKWIFSGGAEADPRTKLHLRAQAQQNREDTARALAQQYNTQAEYAERYVNALPQASENAYLTRKGVLAAPGVKINEKQELVIPFSNAQGQIRSYQRIPPTGGKDARILKNSEKTGNWFTFGTPQNGAPVLFAEGYSTAASIHEATGLPVLMTVDAGNMIAVAENARAAWPDSRFIFCADNDHHLKNAVTGEPENKGILSATRAAELTNGEVIAPAFTPEELEQKLTDFNDMIVSRGKDLARHLINAQLLSIGIQTPFNSAPQIRDTVVTDNLAFTPVQETDMGNQQSPEMTPPSGQNTGHHNTVSEPANITAAEKTVPQEGTRETITLYHGSPATFSAIDSEKIGLGQNLAGKGFYTDTSVLGVHYAMEEINHSDYHVYEVEIPSDVVILDRWNNATFTDELREKIRKAGKTTHAQSAENGDISRAEIANKLADCEKTDDTFLMLASTTQGMSILKEAGVAALKDNSYVAIVNTDLIENVRLHSSAASGRINAEMTQYIDNALSQSVEDAPVLSSLLQNNPALSAHYDAIRTELIALTTAHNRPDEAERLTSLLTHTFVESIEKNADRKTHITPLNRLYAETIRSLDLNYDNSAAKLGRIIDSTVVSINPGQKAVAASDTPAPIGPEPEPTAAQDTPAPIGPEPEPVAVQDTPAPIGPEPEPVAAQDTPDPIGPEPEPVAAQDTPAPLGPEPEPVAVQDMPAPLGPEPEPVAVQDTPDPIGPEPEPVAVQDTPDPIGPEPEPVAVQDMPAPIGPEPEPVAVQDTPDLVEPEPDKQETSPAPETPEPPLSNAKSDAASHADVKSRTATSENEQPFVKRPHSDDETDGIAFGPRRPEAPRAHREDVEKILSELQWETQSDGSVLYRVGGQEAFRDTGNRLEMCDGASQDDKKILAALAVSAKFYGGVIELTGSEAFKERAMRLIVDYELDIRMKRSDQRAQLETLRKDMGREQPLDAVVTQTPTPDLNRHTPDVAPATDAPRPAEEAPAAPPDMYASAAENAPAPVKPDATASTTAALPMENSVTPRSTAAEDPAPTVLKPGQSVTAVLVNHGEGVYENGEKRGESYFIELKNRAGSHVYWGASLKDLVQNVNKGDVVTLTLDSRDTWTKPGEQQERVKNNWSLTPASTGMAVPHNQTERGQQLQSFPVDTFGKITQQIKQRWPQHTQDLKLPPRLEDRNFYLREDRHPVSSPASHASVTPPTRSEPATLTPVMASMHPGTQQLDLLLVRTAGEHLQGVVRLNGTLYPALATPSVDCQQLVINAVTEKGLRFAGYGQAINFEPDGTTRAAPQLMTFQLRGQEDNAPVHARLYTPERQDDALFQRLGFEQSWKQWDESRKQEGRQEINHHQEPSHAPRQ